MKTNHEDLERMCAYCEYSESLVDKDVFLCRRKGIVPADHICRKFVYDALKRVPPKNVQAPSLDFVDLDSIE
ncbi:MAG: hypothetical protein IJT70_02700 [Clostridia bacterium]|nr:hypothetical protein [Clostridia bacterium]